MYIKQLDGDLKVRLFTNSALTGLRRLPNDELELSLHQREQDQHYTRRTEGLVMATGYHYQSPQFIEGIASRLRWDEKDATTCSATTASIVITRCSCRTLNCIRTVS